MSGGLPSPDSTRSGSKLLSGRLARRLSVWTGPTLRFSQHAVSRASPLRSARAVFVRKPTLAMVFLSCCFCCFLLLLLLLLLPCCFLAASLLLSCCFLAAFLLLSSLPDRAAFRSLRSGSANVQRLADYLLVASLLTCLCRCLAGLAWLFLWRLVSCSAFSWPSSNVLPIIS